MTKKNTTYQTKTQTEQELAADSQQYDVVIIGAGMAGLTCAIYAGRAQLKVLVLESKIAGGRITTTEVVKNFPTQESISGIEIGEKLSKQAAHYGVKTEWAIVSKVIKLDKTFVITTESKQVYNSKTVVIATGSDPKKIGIPGEEEYRGRGVSYCATCDGPFYKNKEIAVIGGGDAAIKEALFLTRFVKKITIIHRRDTLRAEKIISAKALAEPKIEVLWDTVAEAITGEGKVITGLKVKNIKTNESRIIFCDGIFIYVGTNPNTYLVQDLVKLTENGYIAAGEDTRTTLPGLFAAGDVRAKDVRQLVTAAADGAVSAVMAQHYLEDNF